MLEEGTLDSTFYPFLLVEIFFKHKTGMLSISSDSELRIYFINGSPVYAEGGERDTLIGRVLMNTGKIDPDTHKEILEKSKNEKKRIGDVLIETGWLSPHEMNNYLELQIEERIMRGFSSLNGVYSFTEDEEMPEGIIEQRIKLPKILNEAVKRFIYAENIEEVNPKIRISEIPDEIISNLELKPKELRTVQLLKNDMDVSEILSDTRLEKYEALKLLYLLGLLKVIELPGVALEAIGRKSIERYISENRMTAKHSDIGEIKENEELVDLELEVYESELTIENGIYKKSHEESLDIFTLDESSAVTDDDQEEFQSPELSSENTEDVEIDSSISEHENDDSNAVPFPEEIEISADDPGSQEQEPEDMEISLDIEEDATSNISTEHLEIKTQTSSIENEIIEEDPEPPDGQEEETETGSFNSIQDSDSVIEQSQHDAPKEITLDETELFSTLEQKEYGFDEPNKDVDEEIIQNVDFAADTEEISADTDDEFTKKITDFHNTLSDKDYYGILGVNEDAPQEEIRDSYYKLVKDYHPDVNQNIPEEVREKAQEIFTAINSAYETLSDLEKRESYNSEEEISDLKTQAQSIYEAEVEYKRGIVLLVQRNYPEAASKLGEALRINPEESAYIGAYAWARFLATEDKNGTVHELIGDLTKAIQINPSIAENYYYLASIHKSLGEIDKAEQNYNKALETDPNYIEAKRELRLINTRKKSRAKTPKESKIEKRFWSGLFKK